MQSTPRVCPVSKAIVGFRTDALKTEKPGALLPAQAIQDWGVKYTRKVAFQREQVMVSRRGLHPRDSRTSRRPAYER